MELACKIPSLFVFETNMLVSWLKLLINKRFIIHYGALNIKQPSMVLPYLK